MLSTIQSEYRIPHLADAKHEVQVFSAKGIRDEYENAVGIELRMRQNGEMSCEFRGEE